MKDIKEGRSTVEIELNIRYHEINNLNKMITNNIRTIESNNRRIAAILMEIEELKTLRVR
jgi:hypothetical protein